MSKSVGVDLHKKSITVSFYDSDLEKHDVRTFRLKAIDDFQRRLHKEDTLG
ncbi:MAG: hypothetical protein GY861_04210, partial [bacterium]|nr:hypothetical protein [bacterium]